MVSSFRPPLDYLLELLPWLQLYPHSVHVTAVLVEYCTSTGRSKQGVATSLFARLKDVSPENRKVPVYIRHSSLRLPFHPVNPVIMVGPGTGLAPFCGFIQDRSTAIKESNGLYY
uniref:NADPH--hemoprotein reductase n=1 Tax=Amphimedon queenslandica TaxID=400682 RepID=A0A1X7SGP0_AMPQE